MSRRLVAATDLEPGMVVDQEYGENRYMAVILEPSRPSKDLFGRAMMRYKARIVYGPEGSALVRDP